MRDLNNLNREHDEKIKNEQTVVYEVYRLIEEQGSPETDERDLVPVFNEDEGYEIQSSKIEDVRLERDYLIKNELNNFPLVIIKETQVIIE